MGYPKTLLRQLHGERALTMLNSFQLSRTAKLRLAHRKTQRDPLGLSKSTQPTTDQEARHNDPTGRRGLPRAVSRLRSKLSQKAKRTKGRSLYEHFYHHLGIEMVGSDRIVCVCRKTKRLR